jgi:uncharacterized protein
MTQLGPNQPTPPPGSTPPPGQTGGGGLTVQNWTVIAHLSALAGFVVPVVGCVVGPLVVWQMKGKDDPRIESSAKAAMNFQITMVIAGAACFALTLIMVGFFLFPVVGLFDLVCVILAAVKASNGETFSYPLSLKLIK